MGAAQTLKVNIVGDAAKLKKTLDGAESDVKGFGSKVAGFGKGLGIGVAAVGTAVVAAGAAAYKLADEFDSAYDSIRIGTGATGKDLLDLEGAFKAVVKDVPTDFASASTAIADLNTRTGATGETLQGLAKNSLELARLTGGDLSSQIASTTRVFGDWGIAAEDQTGALDKLWRASQATGITVDKLAEQVVSYGAPMRELGFSFDETAGFLAKFEKEGVNAELVMGGLKQGLGKLAKAGKDPRDELLNLMDSIEATGLTAENKASVFEMFGARAGIDMAKAIEEGRFELGSLLDTISSGSETILGAAADTEDFAEKWLKFKNGALVAIEPLLMAVFDAAGKVMDRLGPVLADFVDNVVPKVQAAWASVSAGLATVMGVVDQARALWSKVFGGSGEAASGVSAFQQAIAPVWENVKTIVKGAIDAVTTIIRTFVKVGQELWDRFGTHILGFIQRTLKNILQVFEGITRAISGVLDVFVGIFTGDWDKLWGGIQKIFSGVWAAMLGVLKYALDFWRTVIGGAMAAISAVWSLAWNTLKTFLSATLGGMVDTIGEKLGAAVQWFKDLPGRIMDAVGNLGSLLKNAGRDLIDGFLRGITEKFRAVQDKLRELTSKLPDWKGPPERDRTILRDSGHLVMDGFEDGLTDRFGSIRAALAEFTDDLAPEPNTRPGTSGRVVAPAASGDVATAAAAKALRDAAQALASALREQSDRPVQVRLELDGRVLANAVGQHVASPMTSAIKAGVGRGRYG